MESHTVHSQVMERGLKPATTDNWNAVLASTIGWTLDSFDYFVVEVGPHGGPPLHVHHTQEETIHVLSGRFKVRVGEEERILERGGFAFMPSALPHAFPRAVRRRASEPAGV